MKKNNLQNIKLLFLLMILTPYANATWSIIAVDRETGGIGIAGASCTFDVQGIGSIVPGKGAIVVQAASSYYAQMKGVDLMEQNTPIEDILKAMASKEFKPEQQQYGVVVLTSGTTPLVQSGESIADWNGSKIDEDFAVLGNILVSEEVINNAYSKFNSIRDQPLSVRLMSSLKAGEESGGDKRCGPQYARSAFISIYDPKSGAIVKLSVYGIEKGGRPAVTILESQFEKLNK
ncbi:DUF1028 domain-containing protein [Marinicella sp. W31]|uniref:DUF1028 domain-containing protein n=1 Tax=Marinicella sp. W31 TaxID=3023713 RepID=UPI003756DCA4